MKKAEEYKDEFNNGKTVSTNYIDIVIKYT